MSDFWLRVLTLNKSTARQITEKDRPILNYLEDIKLELHDEDMGFTLTFCWEANHYFTQTVTSKSWFMSRPNTVEKCVGTEIDWKQGCDPTHIKKNKKKNKKKITITEKIPSFFDLFQTIDMTNKDEKEDNDDDEEGDEQAEKMDEDMELGNEIKDNIIPLALEIYLGVVELGDSEGEDEDDSGEDDDMDDMPKMPKGMKLPKNFKPGKKGAPNPEDCK